MMSITELPLRLLLLVIVTYSTSLSGCSKTTPTSLVVEEECRKEVAKYPIASIEKRFFNDRKSRGILTLKDLHSGTTTEESSSATTAIYQHILDFKDTKGDFIRLVRSKETGGISLTEANLVTAKFRCRVVWSLFKGKVMSINIKPYLVDLRYRR